MGCFYSRSSILLHARLRAFTIAGPSAVSVHEYTVFWALDRWINCTVWLEGALEWEKRMTVRLTNCTVRSITTGNNQSSEPDGRLLRVGAHHASKEGETVKINSKSDNPQEYSPFRRAPPLPLPLIPHINNVKTSHLGE